MATVEVRPVDRLKWHGKKGKESFARPKTIEVLYDPETGRYATGLTAEEATKYGAMLGGVDLTDTFNFDTPHPYWSTKPACFQLPNHTVLFDTSKPVDYVKVKNMKASKFVANSLKELNEGLWPSATHVIYDEAEEVSLKASKIQLKNKATEKALKLSSDDKVALVQILRNKNLKGRSQDFIDVEIDDILEKDSADFLKYVEMGRDEVVLRATVLELIQKNILTKDGGAIYYLGEQIGHDYEAAIDWLKQPENSKMKVIIFEKLNK